MVVRLVAGGWIEDCRFLPNLEEDCYAFTGMTDEDYILLNLFSNAEEPLDPSQLPEDSMAVMSNTLALLQSIVREYGRGLSQPATIHLRLSHSYEMNAYAARLHPDRADQYLVCVNYGLFVNLYACFMGLLAHPAVLPHVGKPDEEVERFTRAESGIFDFTFGPAYRHQPREDDQLPFTVFPRNEERRQYANLLTNLAVEYIVCHELAHIGCGHLAYLTEKHSLRGFYHNGPIDVKETLAGWPFADSPRKLVELDADFFAGFTLTGVISTQGRTLIGHYDGLLDRYDIWYAWFFSLLTLFHLLEEIRNQRQETRMEYYPSALLRYLFIRYATVFRMEELSEADRERVNSAFEKAITHFLEVTQLLSFSFTFESQLDEALRQEVNHMMEPLETLRTLLRQYNRFRAAD